MTHPGQTPPPAMPAPAMPAPAIVARLSGLQHRYGAVAAADGVDLEIPAG